MTITQQAALNSPSIPPRPQLWRRLAWGLALLTLGAVSVHFLMGVYAKYQEVTPEAYTMFWTRRVWLWAHLGGGAVTIALGPLQFLTRWPRPYARLHRWTGRLYFAGMLVALVGATGLITTSFAPAEIRMAFAATAVAWLITGAVALAAILRGRVEQHRRWVARNYLVTLAPVMFRFMLPLSIALDMVPSPSLIAQLLWLSWLLPLCIGEAFRWIYRLTKLRVSA